MLRPEEKSGLIIRSIDGKTDIYLNGVCINDKCLSCEVKIEGPYRPKATISLLCERVEMDIGKNVEVKKVGRSESNNFIQVRQNRNQERAERNRSGYSRNDNSQIGLRFCPTLI